MDRTTASGVPDGPLYVHPARLGATVSVTAIDVSGERFWTTTRVRLPWGCIAMENCATPAGRGVSVESLYVKHASSGPGAQPGSICRTRSVTVSESSRNVTSICEVPDGVSASRNMRSPGARRAEPLTTGAVGPDTVGQQPAATTPDSKTAIAGSHARR